MDKGIYPGWPHHKPLPPEWAEGELPLVSLVTPSFNQGRFLEATILSVLNQGYPRLEYFIMDGGSQDHSLEVIQRYQDQLTHWESEPDRGQAHAINKGWHRAKGEYLWWLNADDMLAPHSLFSTVHAMQDHPEVDLLYGDHLRMDSQGNPIGRYSYPDFHLEDFLLEDKDIAQAGSLMRRDVLDRIGTLREDLQLLMDKEYWLRLALEGGKLMHISEILALFRIHGEAKTQVGGERAARERVAVTVWLLDHPNLPEGVASRSQRVWGTMAHRQSRAYMKGGSYSQALEAIWQSLRGRPAYLLDPETWITFSLSLLGLIVGHQRLQRLRGMIRRLRIKPYRSP